jgi:hypothetical protein
MAYGQNTQARRRAARQPPEPHYVMFKVKGDPAKVFADMRLPAGASVVVIAPNEAAERSLRRAGKSRFTVDRDWARKPDVHAPGVNAAGQDLAPVIDKQAFEPDARAKALLSGALIAQSDLRGAGGAYDLRAVRTLMHGVSRQRIDKQVREGSLLAVRGPSNRRCYPTIQFQSDGTVVKGLKTVQAALSTRNPWAVLNFLMQPDDRLNGRKPIDLLKEGNIRDVEDAARSLDQQGS